jgi:hypothetical protein
VSVDPGRPTPTRVHRPWPVGRLLIALVAVPILAIAAVVLGSGGTCACTSTPSLDLPPSPVFGVVVRIDTKSLGVINEFDLLTPAGTTVTLAMGQLENALQFSPSHLAAHMASGVPVRAFYRLEEGRPMVYRLEDAVPSPPPAT